MERPNFKRFILRVTPFEKPIAFAISQHEGAMQWVLKQREARLASEAEGGREAGFAENFGKFLLEFFPLTIPGYGIGDILCVWEGITGRQIFGGRHFDNVDRVTSVGCGLIPGYPGIPTRELIRMKRVQIEDLVYKYDINLNKQNLGFS